MFLLFWHKVSLKLNPRVVYRVHGVIIWIPNVVLDVSVKLSGRKASGFSSDVCICFRIVCTESFHRTSSSTHIGYNHWTTLNGNWQQKSLALRACWEKCTNNCIYLLLPHSHRCQYNEAHTPPACRRERGKQDRWRISAGQKEREETREGWGTANSRTGSKRPSGKIETVEKHP